MSRCVLYTVKTFIFVLIIFCIAPKISAVEIRSYPVTDHQVVSKSPYLNKVVYYQNVKIPWKSGKVVVSGSPDGTMPANIGWEIQLYNTKNNTKSFRYNNSGNRYICLDQDMAPLTITHLMNEGDNLFLVRFYRPCDSAISSVDIGPIYFVHFDDYEISDTPFLDLPWDYEADSMRFEEVALRMSSYFDHEYPLLSTSLKEESGEIANTVISYKRNAREDFLYSSHDGYDWARSAGAVLDDPVLAAAPGWATYHYSKYIGNAIFIDHENGYQSRYYHLTDNDLVTRSSKKKWVTDRQQIGRVGFTGNVRPAGSHGAHIHFMVVKDKDGNGSFDDNIPDGIVDPFGWQGSGEDPWSNYSFTYNGQDRTGIKSSYLWKKSLKDGSSTITPDGGTIGNSGSNTKFVFPFQVVSHDVIFDSVAHVPIEKPSIGGIIHERMASIGNSVSVTMQDGFENLITTFGKPFTLIFSFDEKDIEQFEKDTLSIYSSTDGETWQKEETTVDIEKGKASAQINHLTFFALMGDRLDAEAPKTSITLSGTKSGSYYTSPVQLALTADDGPTGTSHGILYTGYRINDEVWTTYSEPVTIANEGEHSIEFYSEDRDGNIEEVQQLSFTIDFSPPTPTILGEMPTNTPANTLAPTASITPTTLPTQTQTQTPMQTLTPTLTPTSKPLVTQTSSPTSKASTSDNHGEVKSVFAAESENDQIEGSNNNDESNILRNLFIIVTVLTTAIILIWYKVGKKNHFWD